METAINEYFSDGSRCSRWGCVGLCFEFRSEFSVGIRAKERGNAAERGARAACGCREEAADFALESDGPEVNRAANCHNANDFVDFGISIRRIPRHGRGLI